MLSLKPDNLRGVSPEAYRERLETAVLDACNDLMAYTGKNEIALRSRYNESVRVLVGTPGDIRRQLEEK